MSKKPDKNIIVGLDIGTSKVVAIVGEITPEGCVEVIGLGQTSSHGLKKGVVVNIESTVEAIQYVMEEAELMAGCAIQSVYTGMAGSHIRSLNSHGVVAIRDHEVSQIDVDKVIEAAKAVAIPADQKILHILPKEFIIDSQEGIKEPIGMSGVRLEVNVHMVTGNASAAQNIVKCVRRCGLEVEDIILSQLASSYAVLSEDEKELGVCLIDIGGGTTDVSVFIQGAIEYTTVIPVAGDQVTNDLAVAFRMPIPCVEKLKIEHGCAFGRLLKSEESFEFTASNSKTRQFSRFTVAEIIEPRYEELLVMVLDELKKRNLIDKISSGIVLTGGGAKIAGIAELAEEIFRLPVRIGSPRYVNAPVDVIDNPIYSTGIGLLLYGRQQQLDKLHEYSSGLKIFGVFNRVKRWVQSNF